MYTVLWLVILGVTGTMFSVQSRSSFPRLKFWRQNSSQVPDKLPSGHYGSPQAYAQAIRNSAVLKKKYDAMMQKHESIEASAFQAAQAYAQVIALHIYELSRTDSFIPNMKVLTDMLERDLRNLKQISIRMCHGDVEEGQKKAAEMIETACEQFNAERRLTGTVQTQKIRIPRPKQRRLLFSGR